VRRIDSSWWLLLMIPASAWTLSRQWHRDSDVVRVLDVLGFLLYLYVVLAHLWRHLRNHDEDDEARTKVSDPPLP
jgi:hypothetical protein